jgi:hypothetical protein
VKPCTNRFHTRNYVSRTDAAEPCEMCGHTSLLHPRPDNPALGACLVCQLEMLLPPRQGPDAPLTPVGAPPVLIHIAMDIAGGRMRPFVDEPAAIALAREHHGAVVSVPVSSDWRAATNG